jgi:hypothetical protein
VKFPREGAATVATILKWLPDIAIVMGPMSIVLPDNETEEEKAKKKENDNKLWDD